MYIGDSSKVGYEVMEWRPPRSVVQDAWRWSGRWRFTKCARDEDEEANSKDPVPEPGVQADAELVVPGRFSEWAATVCG